MKNQSKKEEFLGVRLSMRLSSDLDIQSAALGVKRSKLARLAIIEFLKRNDADYLEETHGAA